MIKKWYFIYVFPLILLKLCTLISLIKINHELIVETFQIFKADQKGEA